MGDKLFHRSQISPDVLAPEDNSPVAVLSPEVLSRCSTAEARDLISALQAKQLRVLPLGILRAAGVETISLAVPQGQTRELLPTLRLSLGHTPRLIEVPGETLAEAIFLAYSSDEKALAQSASELPELSAAALGIAPAVEEPLSTAKVPRFLSALMNYAVSKQASDIHIIPRLEGTFIRLRINGELRDQARPLGSLALHQQLINRIKVLAQLDTTQHQLPLDGQFSIAAGEKRVGIRVSTIPTLHGEKATLRIIGHRRAMELEQLGLDPEALQALRSMLEVDEGMLILAGPTGCGKTTAMYALLTELTKLNLNCVTLEDPIEAEVKNAAQTCISPESGFTFEAALRAVLRQDPDVIMLGEVRDPSSARTAFQAALTGHLVITTVHAREIPEVFTRLKDLGVDALTLQQALRAVIVQRLLPALCPHCRVIDLDGSNRRGYRLYREAGCHLCDYSGFNGFAPVSSVYMKSDVTQSRLALTLQHSLERRLKAGMISVKQFEQLNRSME
ncbi:MAG: GspE/PulE family protein [Oligoflexia bacterium]|nr:GspE/PulE family protein [Oligoflexia bacterium]